VSAAGPSGRTAGDPPVEVVIPGVMGYVDRPSAAPGETVAVHVSCDAAPEWEADLVRLLSSDLAPEGPPLRERAVADVPPARRPAIDQPTRVGSYVRVDLIAEVEEALRAAPALTVAAFVMPSRPGVDAHGLISWRDAGGDRGWTLGIGPDGAARVEACTAAGRVVIGTGTPLVHGCWYAVAATIDPERGAVSVRQAPAGPPTASRAVVPAGTGIAEASAPLEAPLRLPAPGVALLLAATGWDAEGDVLEPFDGRLDRPRVLAGAVDGAPALDTDPPAPIACWDFAAGITGHGIAALGHVHDAGPHGAHGRCVNRPTRAVTGHNWDSSIHDFRHAPEQYAAIHFHRDDMGDCAWEAQLDLRLPEDLPSGVYAVRVRAGDAVDRIPFAVRPRSEPTAPLLLVLPTNSYLAYANDHVAIDSPRVQMLMRRVPLVDPYEEYRDQHRELGSSLYEAHPDGTGICWSTWRRPILTMRPYVRLFNARAWQFTADLQIVDWLDRTARSVDVVCDRDVHDGGVELLSRYRGVITGTHPEYVTGAMLDALHDYVHGGGRLAYLGGNGLYWVTGYDAEDPHAIEIRRFGGTESWRAGPGEVHLSSTGELGGLWRHRGRAPQKLVGVGFVAQGLDAASGYRVRADFDPRAAWVLDGVDDDLFGFFGTMGGAAGMEIDAVDPSLGTPPQTIVLATSEGHPDDMLEARENYGMTLTAPGGARNPRVHADMVLVPWENGGGVFAPGSITWAGSLAHDGYANPVSTILGNVLDRFASGAPLLDP
jgi:N,N-dimethylformamidase